MVTLYPKADPAGRVDSAERSQRAPKIEELSSTEFPTRAPHTVCEPFASLEGTEKPFFPELRVHTSHGQELRTLLQSQIHFATKNYRLRSDHLAQTLRLFGDKVARHLPDGFCVQVALSSLEGNAACDTVTLIQVTPKLGAHAILEQHYAPFNGGGVGWMVPTDEAKNTVLKLEERLFYYKTFLAVRTAVGNRLSMLSSPA